MNQVEVTITLKAILPEGTDLPERLNYVLADALSEYNANRLRRSWGAPTMEEAQAYVEERYKTKGGSSWPTDAWRAEKAVMVLAATTWAAALRDAALQMGPVEIRNVHRCTCCGDTQKRQGDGPQLREQVAAEDAMRELVRARAEQFLSPDTFFEAQQALEEAWKGYIGLIEGRAWGHDFGDQLKRAYGEWDGIDQVVQGQVQNEWDRR